MIKIHAYEWIKEPFSNEKKLFVTIFFTFAANSNLGRLKDILFKMGMISYSYFRIKNVNIH